MARSRHQALHATLTAENNRAERLQKRFFPTQSKALLGILSRESWMPNCAASLRIKILSFMQMNTSELQSRDSKFYKFPIHPHFPDPATPNGELNIKCFSICKNDEA